MIVLGLDSATPSSVAGLLLADGEVLEARDDPAAGSRGDHAARLLGLAAEVMARAGVGWEDVDRMAVGVGPGGFTGLRIGIATARALAQARGIEVVPVSTLAALAAGAAPAARVAAVLDARRGEAYVAVREGDLELIAPCALAPDALAARLAALGPPLSAVGDGAVRFRAELEGAGIDVPEDGAAVHRVAAAPLCRLGAAGVPVGRDRLLPDYRREPDAKPPPPR